MTPVAIGDTQGTLQARKMCERPKNRLGHPDESTLTRDIGNYPCLTEASMLTRDIGNYPCRTEASTSDHYSTTRLQYSVVKILNSDSNEMWQDKYDNSIELFSSMCKVSLKHPKTQKLNTVYMYFNIF